MAGIGPDTAQTGQIPPHLEISQEAIGELLSLSEPWSKAKVLRSLEARERATQRSDT